MVGYLLHVFVNSQLEIVCYSWQHGVNMWFYLLCCLLDQKIMNSLYSKKSKANFFWVDKCEYITLLYIERKEISTKFRNLNTEETFKNIHNEVHKNGCRGSNPSPILNRINCPILGNIRYNWKPASATCDC